MVSLPQISEISRAAQDDAEKLLRGTDTDAFFSSQAHSPLYYIQVWIRGEGYSVFALQKKSNINFQITWKILKQAIAYNPSSKRCNLCLWEKYFIICKPHLFTLKSPYRHASLFLLKNFKSSSVTL